MRAPELRSPVSILGLIILLAVSVLPAGQSKAQTSDLVDRSLLRVCADPANLPFSSEDRNGFENKIANLIADRLDVPVVYEWFPQATGFVRQTLASRKCDIIMGYAQGHELVQNTNHYYRSSYVMLHLANGKLDGITSLNDERLKSSRIGVTAGTPPATVLALNRLLGNIEPYLLMVDRRHESPAEQMVRDLESGKIDVALLWGPIGGNLAKNSKADIAVVPLVNETKGPRMAFRITFGIRRGEIEWKRKLNELIKENQPEINKIMLEFGVPILDENDQLIKE
ncbi:MAG: quinoprotein dehydrogenase-associated putative ABC transporter substrate-binding protein [Rhizobiales bacterium]|nr:quinoprotein dehydrogenase-associated putative ABC transporter substrate-binding protein [Hyphomicrobiales bacterium]